MTSRTITNVSPLPLAKVSAVVYGLMGCIAIPFGWLGFFMGESASLGFVILFPVMYAIGGFLAGLVGALLFNVASGWMGGIKVVFDE